MTPVWKILALSAAAWLSATGAAACGFDADVAVWLAVVAGTAAGSLLEYGRGRDEMAFVRGMLVAHEARVTRLESRLDQWDLEEAESEPADPEPDEER